FPEAHKPAYQLTIDFGALGIKKSSAQITSIYKKTDLLNKQIVAVVNFPKKQIAKFNSECLVLGAVQNKDVFLLNPETNVKNGTVVS
ncbi:MAG: tRNA-binding protein, partial [Oceanihabitans sp.]